jgi:HD superfamily phosphohydrolase
MNSSKKDKLFRDSVHGYIPIPDSYCYHFIDTPEFQRLRRIEQTSIRVLFPSARHDRFIHSIGVFYLGVLAISHIENNSKEILSNLKKGEWAEIKATFEIACLLHDIGHTPFSHTFEKYLDKPACLDDILSEIVGKRDAEFSKDIKFNSSKPHERSSGIIILKRFAEIMESKFNASPVLAVRMVIGLRYRGTNLSLKERISNRLINLLNGRTIDVDRLDYVNRDAWASGYSSGSIDIKRLLSSIAIKSEDGGYEDLKLAFHKNALSQITSVLDAKNFQNYWLFTHHKVVYDQYILRKSIENLATLLIEEQEEQALSILFNVNNFFEPRQIGNYNIYLPTDDDIIFLLKSNIDLIPYAKEFLYRQHKLKPLWKTYAEFYSLFCGANKLPEEDIEENGPLHRVAKSDNIGEFIGAASTNDYLIRDVKPKFSLIRKQNIFIDLGNKISCYTELGLPFQINKQPKPFFIIFVKDELLKNKNAIVDCLIAQAKS